MSYEQSLLFTPEGVRDIYGIECEKRRKIEADIHKIMKSYGFKDIQTPTYEFFDIFNILIYNIIVKLITYQILKKVVFIMPYSAGKTPDTEPQAYPLPAECFYLQ